MKRVSISASEREPSQGVLTGLSLLLLLCSCGGPRAAVEKSPAPVHLSAVELYTPTEGQRYSASILPNRQVNLAFRVNGFVESIHQVRGADGRMRTVDIGQVVEAGTTLAQVRSKDYELQVSQAQGQMNQAQDAGQTAHAQLEQAQAAAVKAEQDYERADALYKKTSLTKSDLDAARANRDSTQAQVEAARSQVRVSSATVNSAQAALGTAGLGLHDSSLVAPFRGVIVQRSVEIGTLASPGMIAFVLADISSVKATFAVSDILISHLKNGSKLSTYAEAFPNRSFQGFVSAVAAVADSTTRAFQVEVTIPNRGAVLRPGMIVSLDVGASPAAQRVQVVPLNAIVRSTGGTSQFAVVVVDDGVAERRPVTLGPTYGDLIAVAGIDPGTKVVSSGASFVNDGQKVKVIP
ncbi:MAG: efflux RND transporter periplasmic adaptor subunit [Bryobacteraceae bacterium]